MTTQSRDIVERLEECLDETFAPIDIQDGRVVSCDVLREAITEIKFLRKAAGAVSQGPGFAEITKDLPRRSTESPDPS